MIRFKIVLVLLIILYFIFISDYQYDAQTYGTIINTDNMYHTRYEFYVNGVKYTNIHTSIKIRIYNKFSVGDKVLIKYSKKDPSNNYIHTRNMYYHFIILFVYLIYLIIKFQMIHKN